MNMSHHYNETGLFLKNLSAQDFMNFGLQQMAYIKPIMTHGKTVYAIHAADGKVLLALDSSSAALMTILQNNLEPVSLH